MKVKIGEILVTKEGGGRFSSFVGLSQVAVCLESMDEAFLSAVAQGSIFYRGKYEFMRFVNLAVLGVGGWRNAPNDVPMPQSGDTLVFGDLAVVKENSPSPYPFFPMIFNQGEWKKINSSQPDICRGLISAICSKYFGSVNYTNLFLRMLLLGYVIEEK